MRDASSLDLEHIHQEVAHADMDLVEQPAFGRIERVVQIEEPDFGLGQGLALFLGHIQLPADQGDRCHRA